MPVLPPACPIGQTAVSWNQTGAQGPQGPQGSQGPQGPQGATGAQGRCRPKKGLTAPRVQPVPRGHRVRKGRKGRKDRLAPETRHSSRASHRVACRCKPTSARGSPRDRFPLTPIRTLNLPGPADYLLTATVTVHNLSDFFLQDNSRRVTCLLTDNLDPSAIFGGWEAITLATSSAFLDGAGGNNVQQTMTVHVPLRLRFVSSGAVYLSCFAAAETDPNHVPG